MNLFSIIAIFLFAAGFLALIKFLEFPRRLNKVVYKEYWATKILPCLDEPMKYQLAIIEADKLLDRALKEKGIRGQTMGERLVIAGKHFANKDALWTAHKLRNRLVHETDVALNLKQTKRSLAAFARALKDLGAL